MVIKRSIQCRECKKYIDIYIKENQSLKNIIIECKCGNKEQCIEENKHINRWKKIQ